MRAGVIGTGVMGQEHLRALKACGVTKPCVCDVNEENARYYAEMYDGEVYSDYKEMLKFAGLDFVSVCVPTSMHYAFTMEALDKGVGVLCEKPFSATVEQAKSMVQKSHEKGCTLMVGHCLRFYKPYIYLKHIVEDGRFGKLLSLNMYRHSAEPLWSVGGWMKDVTLSGGAAIDLHIHETDMAIFLLGMPKAVTTTGSYKQCATLYHYGDNDMAISAQSSWRSIQDYPFASGFDANFEQAVVSCSGDSVRVIRAEGIQENVLDSEPFPAYVVEDNAYVNEMNYFIQHRAAGNLEECPPQDSLMSLQVVKAEIESFQTKKTIALSL